MKNSREEILGRVRDALTPLPKRARYPEYAADAAVMQQLFADGRDLWKIFSERLAAVNGIAMEQPAALVGWLRERGHLHGYCDPALWPGLGPHFDPAFNVETTFDRTRVDDYSFGITCAAGAIAETGTIILQDAGTSRRLGALTPWVHIALVPREKMFATIPEAITQLGSDPNTIWVTGPSKTADVEGILIEGVHGPGAQIALLLR
jgi:L-lactate dehydrogenase complex protein LldG